MIILKIIGTLIWGYILLDFKNLDEEEKNFTAYTALICIVLNCLLKLAFGN